MPVVTHQQVTILLIRFSVLKLLYKGKIKREKEKRWWKGRRWGIPNRLVPAIAVVCLLIVAFGWFSMREGETPSTFQTGRNLTSEQQMIAKDLEVIRNLELLEELEVLEKLVQVVDERNSL